jgi:cytochrome P450
MRERPPVSDWSTDFDHLDPRWIENPYPIWDELREKCPIAHTARYQGVYFPSRHEDVRAVAYDTEHFSSRRIIVREVPPPRIPAPPITSDPPEHRADKNLLTPAFTPDAIKRHEPRMREICARLIARFAGKGGCDAAVDYAQEIPVRIIARMLGLPEEEGERFRKWIHEILEVGITDPAVLMRALGETQV